MKGHRSSPRRRRRASRPRCEWIGALRATPLIIEDDAEPFRPAIALWVEAPSGLVVAQEILKPGDSEGALGRVLAKALEQPTPGAQPAPDAVRVEDADFVAEVRTALRGRVPVEVAPTPEIDEVMAAFVEATASEEPDDRSYFEDGQIAPRTVERLFVASRILYDIAPWQMATDDRVVRMDIPRLGVEGACVSIIGNLDESLGLLIFPSLLGYEAFLDAAEGGIERKGRLDLGTDWLALNFERGDELPRTMRREVMSHSWPLANADAHPVVGRFERDGIPRPVVTRDLEIAAACATSVGSFYVSHRNAFEARAIEPACESYFDEDDLEVCLTIPYEAHALFELPERLAAPVKPAKVGRNDPCPCGSGRKYKKCHLAADRQVASPPPQPETLHDLDRALVEEMTDFAFSRFGRGWRQGSATFADFEAAIQLAAIWYVYHHEVEGKPMVAWFLAEQGQYLPRAKRRWLEAQQETWLSVWEVTEVEAGVGMTLRDLLSDETRDVCEVRASQTLVVRDAILARIVDHDGASHICGLHPRALGPPGAAGVVRRARGRLRRKRAVPVERLSTEAIGRYLIRRWEEAVAECDAASSVPAALANTDGDPFLLTRDHFDVVSGAQSTVESKLAALAGVEPPDDDGTLVYHFMRIGNAMHKSWDNTLIGEARFFDRELLVETNSRERADTLRERIEAACGNHIHHRLRELEDPLSSQAARPDPDHDPEPPTSEMQQLMLEFKQRHYASWTDEPIPALGDQTPREACTTADGCNAVDVLLKDMENLEQGTAPGERFDFSGLRQELGLD